MGRTAWGKSALIKLSPILSFKEVTRASQMLKNPPAMPETWVQSPSWEDPWRREWIHTPVSLPGEFHGQRSLAGYSPWGHKELDTAEATEHILRYSTGGQMSIGLICGSAGRHSF